MSIADAMPDYQAILEQIHSEVLSARPAGQIATYIPGLAEVDPGKYSVAVWSPPLNLKGNSAAGFLALEKLTDLTGTSIF